MNKLIIFLRKPLSPAFRQGYDAYYAEGRRAKCPFDYVLEDEWKDWQEGWEAGAGEDDK